MYWRWVFIIKSEAESSLFSFLSFAVRVFASVLIQTESFSSTQTHEMLTKASGSTQRVTAIRSLGPPSDRSAGCAACRSLSVSASPLGRWKHVSSLSSSPGSGVYYCPQASSGRGSLLFCWSRSACLWRSSGDPESPGLCPALRPDRKLASRHWPDGSGSWGTRPASARGVGHTGQSKAGSTESRSDLERRQRYTRALHSNSSLLKLSLPERYYP